MSRNSYYGMLNVKTTDPEVIKIWRSRDDELDELPVTNFEECVDYAEALETKSLVERILSKLRINENEQYVLLHRVMGGAKLAEVADELGVTTERVRQMQTKLRYKMIYAMVMIDRETENAKLAMKLMRHQ